jgi:hypothetical protein
MSPAVDRSDAPAEARTDPRRDLRPEARGELRPELRPEARGELRPEARAEPRTEAVAPFAAVEAPQPSPAATDPVVAPAPVTTAPAGPLQASAREAQGPDAAGVARPTCTVAQLRRFIKSRPWIPLHELRRRFGIYGGDDDVSPIRVGDHTLFIGLPPAESRLMAELLDGGDVGYELSLDPGAPIVVGVYPMRPVPRG